MVDDKEVEVEVQQEEVDYEIEEAPPPSEEQKELEGIETKGAQKRIRQLVKQRKEREEQLNMALGKIAQLEEQLDFSAVQTNNSEIASIASEEKQLSDKISLSKQGFADALEQGDNEKIVAAQEAMVDAQSELKLLQVRKNYLEAQPKEVPQRQPMQVPPQENFDPLAMEWAQRNEWFGQDSIATAAALAIDQKLKNEGKDPSSESFYAEVDRELARELPHKFGKQEPRKPAQVVAGQSRTPASGKKVRLSQKDVALAQKWGIPLEQMATEKAKIDIADGDYTPIG
jgi:hypothetical protein